MSEWQSENINELAGALAKAKLEFNPIVKGVDNPAYVRGGKAMKYADLSTIIEATEEAMAKNGLSLIQSPDVNVADHSMSLIGVLVHSSGQWMRFVTTLPAVQRERFDAQSCGSAITYARRYQYKSIIGAAEEDDDANMASGVGSKEAAKAVGNAKVAELKSKAKPSDQDLVPALQASIAQQEAKKLNLPPVPSPTPTPAPDADLLEEMSGSIQQVRDMQTSPAKGSKSYRRIAIATFLGGEIIDREITAWDNFVLSDGKLFDFLTPEANGQTATLLVEKVEKAGKVYWNLKDVKQIGERYWENRLGFAQRNAHA